MSVSRIASRYAKSLIDLAIEQDKLEQSKEDISAFQKATENRDLYLLLKSPIINTSKKKQVLKALFDEHFGELSMSFFNIILNKKREALLPEIAEEFIRQYKAFKQISTVHLTTAAPLGAEVVSKIKQKLVSSSATQSNVEIITRVDPHLIGGFVIEIDDSLYDASVVHQLERLKKEFSKNEYIKKN